MKINIKSNKAITLVALVITIIILLILAGVTVMTLNGDNGLFKNALNARKKYNEAAFKEELEMELIDLRLEAIERKQEFSLEFLQEYINKNIFDIELEYDENNKAVSAMINKKDNNKLVAIINNKLQIENVETGEDINVNGIKLDNTLIELYLSNEKLSTKQLIATVFPQNASNKSVTWSSSDNTIAEVDNKGLVIAKSKGNAIIKCISNDGEYEATCNVIVKDTGITIVDSQEIDNETGLKVLKIEEYVDKSSDGDTILIPAGSYRLTACNVDISGSLGSGYGSVGICDKGKAINFVGENEKTRIVFYGKDSTRRDGGAITLHNKNSIIRNLIYEYHPEKGTYYSDTIFAWTNGMAYNVYFDVIGKGGYTYYNTQPLDANIVKNCTFHFSEPIWSATGGPKTKYYDIVANYEPPEGTIYSKIIKSFSNLEETKKDEEINNAEAGVYFGEHAWK